MARELARGLTIAGNPTLTTITGFTLFDNSNRLAPVAPATVGKPNTEDDLKITITNSPQVTLPTNLTKPTASSS